MINYFLLLSICDSLKISKVGNGNIILHQVLFSNWTPIIVVLLTGLIAIHQIRVNNITNARIKWLQNLKTLLTDFLVSTSNLIQNKIHLIQINEAWLKNANNKLTTQDADLNKELKLKILIDAFDNKGKLKTNLNLIDLNLNSKELPNQNLMEMLKMYLKMSIELFETDKDDKDEDIRKKMVLTSKLEGDIIHLSGCIMKLEWEKTKRWRPYYWYYLYIGNGRKIYLEAKDLKFQKV
jgi:hypothetical protein